MWQVFWLRLYLPIPLKAEQWFEEFFSLKPLFERGLGRPLQLRG
jgi:hypothetical protein